MRYLRSPLIAVLILAAVVRLIGIRFPFGGYDEGVYLATVRSVCNGFPLVSQTYNSQGPLFIYLASLFYLISPTIASVRMFPVVCSLAIIFFSYRLIQRHVGRVPAIFAGLFLSLDKTFLEGSRCFNADIPWLAFSLASFYFLLRFHQTEKRRYVVGSAISLFCGFMIKTNPLLIPVTVTYFLMCLPRRGISYLRFMLCYPIAGIILLLILVRPHDLKSFYVNAIWMHSAHTGISFGEWLREPRIQLIKHEFPLVLLSIVSAVELAIAWSRAPAVRLSLFFEQNILVILSLVWLALTTIAFSAYAILLPHHFVFFVAPAVLSASLAIQRMVDRAGTGFKAATLCALVLVSTLAFAIAQGGTIAVILFPRPTAYDAMLLDVANRIRAETSPHDFIVIDDQLGAYLADRNVPPDLVDTSGVRIASGLLTRSQVMESVSRYRPAVVVLISGRLVAVPALIPALRVDYRETHPCRRTSIFFRRAENDK